MSGTNSISITPAVDRSFFGGIANVGEDQGSIKVCIRHRKRVGTLCIGSGTDGSSFNQTVAPGMGSPVADVTFPLFR